MEKWEIRLLATPKPLNRSPRLHTCLRPGYNIISTNVRNLVTISQAVSFPRMREIAHKKLGSASFFRVLPTAHSPGPWTDFHAKYLRRRGFAQGCAFSGLEKKNLTFNIHSFRKPPFLCPLLTGLRKWTALQWGMLYVLPLIVLHVNSP